MRCGAQGGARLTPRGVGRRAQDPVKAEEERELGNARFKEGKFPEAVQHYSEAIKRNPRDHRAYSNRSACYTKLAAWNEGLKDAETCIELAPTFGKGYSRKGAVQFFMKDYDKALATYQAGLAHDPDSDELKSAQAALPACGVSRAAADARGACAQAASRAAWSRSTRCRAARCRRRS